MVEKLRTGHFLISYGIKYRKIFKLVFPHNLQGTVLFLVHDVLREFRWFNDVIWFKCQLLILDLCQLKFCCIFTFISGERASSCNPRVYMRWWSANVFKREWYYWCFIQVRKGKFLVTNSNTAICHYLIITLLFSNQPFQIKRYLCMVSSVYLMETRKWEISAICNSPVMIA